MDQHLKQRTRRMVRQVDNPPALRMPPPASPQSPNSGKIGVVRYPPELHIVGSGKDSVINPFEHLPNNGGAKLILEELDWSLT